LIVMLECLRQTANILQTESSNRPKTVTWPLNKINTEFAPHLPRI
jgi:hypothetical protein